MEHMYNKMNDVVCKHRKQKIRRAFVLIIIFISCKLCQYVFECYCFVVERSQTYQDNQDEKFNNRFGAFDIFELCRMWN